MSSGGGETRTIVQQGPPSQPSLLPEARPGYLESQQFYRNVLGQPPIFGGQRVAPIPGATQAGLESMRTIGAGGAPPEQVLARDVLTENLTGAGLARNPFATPQDIIDPTTRQTAAGGAVNPYTNAIFTETPELLSTAEGGGYGRNPFTETTQEAILEPIFSRFREETIPSIRDVYTRAGQPMGSRRVVSTEQAVSELGRSAAQALAPYASQTYEAERSRHVQANVDLMNSRAAALERAGRFFDAERVRQEAAALASSDLTTRELTRAGGAYEAERGRTQESIPQAVLPELFASQRAQQLLQAGQLERGFSQEALAAQQAQFEEPIFRQSAAATALAGAPSYPGVSTGATTTGYESPGIIGGMQNLATTALLTSMAVKGMRGG